MDTDALVAEIVYRLIHTNVKYQDPILACTDAVVADYCLSLSGAQRDELRHVVSARLQALAANKLPFVEAWARSQPRS